MMGQIADSAVNVLHAALRPAALPAWAIGPFVRPTDPQPIISPRRDSVFFCPMRQREVHWEALHTFNPAAIVQDDQVMLLYRAEDDWGEMAIGQHTSRLGLGSSSDGQVFARRNAPVFYPAKDSQQQYEWDGGCEDPRLVETEDGRFILAYTQWDRHVPRLAIASSSDLFHWTKHGPAFHRSHGGRYSQTDSKAGSIVCKLVDGRLKAARIDGRYWMYWGEYFVRIASSENLLDWTVHEDGGGKPTVVLPPRPGRFDSLLAEPGPPAVLTDHGIVLIYNAKNGGDHELPGLETHTYSAGQALFDKNDPTKLLAQLDTPFFQPEVEFERSGQYISGTTFVEGLVHFRGRWILYYGCADSLVGVAMTP